MAPGPAAPAPLSNSARTSGVWAAKSWRAAARFLAPVKRMAGSGAWLDTPAANPVNWSRMVAARAVGWVGTLRAT
jgi:hypothetical protein